MAELDQMREMATDALERIKERIIANIDSLGLKASGKTQNSLEVVPYDFGVRLMGRQYFQGLEIGRPAGAVPYGFRDIIKQWIIDKGLTPAPFPYKTNRVHKYTQQERDLNHMAGAVAHNIRVRGFAPWRNGGRAPSPQRDVYTPAIDAEVPTLTEQFVQIITQTLYNEYDKNTGLKKQ